MNIICISKEGCEANNLTPGEALLLLAIHNNYDLEKERVSLVNAGLITQMPTRNDIPGKYVLTRNGVNAINNIVLDSIKLDVPNNTIEELALKLKELFPKGKKPGTNYYWADGQALIVRRLKLFFKKYGEFDNDAILDATQRYINSFNGNYRYMKLLKYFILKEEKGAGGDIEGSSELLNYLENTGEDVIENNDWTSELV